MTRFGMKPCEKKNQIIFNYLKFVSVLRVLALVSLKGEGARVARSHPFFSVNFFLHFENIISPSKRTTRCRKRVTLPVAAKIYCCLIRYSFVFMLNRPQKGYNVLASKGNTMAEIVLF